VALEKRVKDFEKALYRLEEAYKKALDNRNNEEYPFFRDSAIQRFEFTAEIMWKALKDYLKEVNGIECRSPKGCIREFFSTGNLTPEETTKLLETINSKNKTPHTYHEEIAEEIFSQLTDYIPLIKKVLERIYI
jgi:nucleotidyltransferase substrate binding protein (TIGR01987 family)